MQNKQIRYATILALTTAFISGTANFLNKIAVTAIKDPVIFTTLKNAIVAIFLAGIILAFKKWPEIISLTKKQFLKLLAVGIIGGSLPFVLFFTGLAKTSALNAGLIHKTLFLWVAILAIPFLKEKMTMPQWIGIGMIFASNLLIGGFTGFKYNTGELMILMATILWAVENIIAKTALENISSVTVAASRMIFGSLILLFFADWHGGLTAVFQLNFEQWGWTLITSGLLLGYVLTWYAALKHAPATYVATLLVPATLVTNILTAIFITHSFSVSQFLSVALLASGSALMIIFIKKTADQTASENNRINLNPLS